jgi:peptidase A4-like protein
MRLPAPRTLAVALSSAVCLLTAWAAVAPRAQAAPGSERPAVAGTAVLTSGTAPGPPHPSAPAISQKVLSHLSRLLHAHRHGTDAALSSANWSGYEVSGAADSSLGVTANWVQPSVSCTTNGIVVFWVGLDGVNNSTVEQTGTGVDCSSGVPQLFAWYEFFPSPLVELSDPVAVGDHLSATVIDVRRSVSLSVTDNTRGWTDGTRRAFPGPSASAEVITEAASSGGAVTALPDFHSMTYTGAQAEPNSSPLAFESLQALGATAINMVSGSGAVIAAPGPLDAAGDFTVTDNGG